MWHDASRKPPKDTPWDARPVSVNPDRDMKEETAFIPVEHFW